MKTLLWPGLLIVLLVTSAGANLAMLTVAFADPGFSTPKDYYERAVHFDDDRAQEELNQVLGWRIQVSSAVASDLLLALVIDDAAGAPLVGAKVHVEAYPVARAQQTFEVTATERQPGHYQVNVSATRRGLWDLRVHVLHAGQAYDRVIRHEVL